MNNQRLHGTANYEGPFQKTAHDSLLNLLSNIYLFFKNLVHFNAILMLAGVIDTHFKNLDLCYPENSLVAKT